MKWDFKNTADTFHTIYSVTSRQFESNMTYPRVIIHKRYIEGVLLNETNQVYRSYPVFKKQKQFCNLTNSTINDSKQWEESAERGVFFSDVFVTDKPIH